MSCTPGEIAELRSKTGTPAWLAVLTAGTIAVGSDGVSTRALTCLARRSLTSEISVDMSPPPFSRSTFMPSLVASWVSAVPIAARNGFVVSLIMTPRVYAAFPVPAVAPGPAAELDVPELQAARPRPRMAAMPARAGRRSDRGLDFIWVIVEFTVLSLGGGTGIFGAWGSGGRRRGQTGGAALLRGRRPGSGRDRDGRGGVAGGRRRRRTGGRRVDAVVPVQRDGDEDDQAGDRRLPVRRDAELVKAVGDHSQEQGRGEYVRCPPDPAGQRDARHDADGDRLQRPVGGGRGLADGGLAEQHQASGCREEPADDEGEHLHAVDWDAGQVACLGVAAHAVDVVAVAGPGKNCPYESHAAEEDNERHRDSLPPVTRERGEERGVSRLGLRGGGHVQQPGHDARHREGRDERVEPDLRDEQPVDRPGYQPDGEPGQDGQGRAVTLGDPCGGGRGRGADCADGQVEAAHDHHHGHPAGDDADDRVLLEYVLQVDRLPEGRGRDHEHRDHDDEDGPQAEPPDQPR